MKSLNLQSWAEDWWKWKSCKIWILPCKSMGLNAKGVKNVKVVKDVNSPCTARRWVWTFSSLRSSHTYILKILSEFDSAWQCFTFWIWKKCFLLFSYFCCLVAARRPCQGRVPWELIWYRVGIVNWFGLTPFWNLRTRQFKAGCHLDEVHEDISKALHIVPPTLLDPKVSVDRRIASRPRQVLVFSEHLQQLWKTVLHQSATILTLPVWYVLVCPCVPILLGKPKVNDVHKVSLFAQTPENW